MGFDAYHVGASCDPRDPHAMSRGYHGDRVYISKGVWGAAWPPGSMVKSRSGSRTLIRGSRFAPYVRAAGRAALGIAGRTAERWAASRLSGSSSAKTVSTAPLTGERDYRVVYRKKRMPKRKKRRYVRSMKRFRSAMLREEPARIFQFLAVNDYQSGLNACRYFGAFMGLFANNFYDNNFGEVYNNITNVGAATLKAEAAKLRVDHTSLRVVLRNVTTGFVEGGIGTIDLDVYEVVCCRDLPLAAWSSSNGVESFAAVQKNKLRQATGMDIEVSDVGVAIPTSQQNAGTSSITQAIGDLLWNNPLFLRYFKVLKQFKIQLPVGSTTEFSMRSSKNRVVLRDQCFGNNALAAKAWLTKGYVFNINGRPTLTGPGTYEFANVSVIVEQYVRYNCKPLVSKAPTYTYDGL